MFGHLPLKLSICEKMLMLAAAVALQASSAWAQRADPRLLALSCAGCHGPAGRSPGTIPPLSGKSETAIAEALRGFRADQRPSTVMGRIAKGYSDQEIDAVAHEMAAQWK
jgi:cytochrome c553